MEKKIIGANIEMKFTETLDEEAIEKLGSFMAKSFKLCRMSIKPIYGDKIDSELSIVEQEEEFTSTGKEFNPDDFTFN